MKKILFLHGLNWSGECPPALTLRKELEDVAEITAPDLPVNPEDALKMLLDICDTLQPDLIIGSSYGAFLGQQLIKIVGAPALLCSSMFRMTNFLRLRIGTHNFKSRRADGIQSYEITPELIDVFQEMENHQFDCYDEWYRDKVVGFYGLQDTLAKTKEEFRKYYSIVIEYDGPHTMTPDNVKSTLAPVARATLAQFPRSSQRLFRHFKGNSYRLVCHAKDSETLDRQVTYQALYGNRGYWVRPEQMFFERVVRNGSSMPRFAEVGHI